MQAEEQVRMDEEAAPLISPSSCAPDEAAERPPEKVAPPSGKAPLSAAACAAFWDSGTACVLGAALSFSLAATLVKVVEDAIPVFEIVVVRALVSGTVTALACRLRSLPLFGSQAPVALLVARGVIGALAMTTSYEAIVRLPLADSVGGMGVVHAWAGGLAGGHWGGQPAPARAGWSQQRGRTRRPAGTRGHFQEPAGLGVSHCCICIGVCVGAKPRGCDTPWLRNPVDATHR